VRTLAGSCEQLVAWLPRLEHTYTRCLPLVSVPLFPVQAVVLESIALTYVSSTETSVIFSTEPLWAAATSAVVLGKRPGNKAIWKTLGESF
jgi:drug/metabolite transporter (DMT)-like permease